MPISKLLTKNLYVCKPSDTIDILINALSSKNIRAIICADRDNLIGCETAETINRWLGNNSNKSHKDQKHHWGQGKVADLPWSNTYSHLEKPIAVDELLSALLSKGLDVIAIKTGGPKIKWQAAVFSELRIEVGQYTAKLAAHARQVESYVQILSHDIRAPLSVIDLAASYLATSPSVTEHLTDEDLSFIKRIESGVRRCTDLIAAMLDIGSLDNENKIDRQEVSVRSFLDSRMSDWQILGQNKNISFDLVIPQDFKIMIDSQRLGQALENLVGNALKFSPKGKRITIRGLLESADDNCTYGIIEVSDQGRGIPADACEKIFDPYKQLDGQVALKHGVGLGLYIANKFVGFHGGSIKVASQVGQGSTFAIRLPQSCLEPTVEDSGQQPLKILVVDDDRDIQDYLQDELKQFGYDVACVSDGLGGLSRFHQFEPDLVISDIRMPGLDGIDLLTRLKVFAPGVPIILASGFHPQLTQKMLGKYSHVSVINKPFSLDKLKSLIENLVEASRQKPKGKKLDRSA